MWWTGDETTRFIADVTDQLTTRVQVLIGTPRRDTANTKRMSNECLTISHNEIPSVGSYGTEVTALTEVDPLIWTTRVSLERIVK